jgi:hypothetical protein
MRLGLTINHLVIVVLISVMVIVVIEVSIVRYEIRIARFGTSQRKNDTDRTSVSLAQ